MQPVSSDAPAYPDESSAKYPRRRAARSSARFGRLFPHTLPILAGFLFLGFAYGLLMRTKGFSFLYPMCMAMTISAVRWNMSPCQCCFQPSRRWRRF